MIFSDDRPQDQKQSTRFQLSVNSLREHKCPYLLTYLLRGDVDPDPEIFFSLFR